MHPLLASGAAVNVDLDPTFLVHFVLFTSFVLLMKPLIFDPLIRVWEERERLTEGAIGQARAMDEEAIVLKQHYDERFEGVRREAGLDRDRLRGELNALEAKLTAAAREAAGLHLGEGRARALAEVQRIRQDLQRQRQHLAAEIATRVLGREVR
ncbi:MAG: ATP synthase F0 subunit B [Deltaproteobacteria bacterium]|nr:ATP synthase F0 subunit B [Deltaproteobacteria bacterium]